MRRIFPSAALRKKGSGDKRAHGNAPGEAGRDHQRPGRVVAEMKVKQTDPKSPPERDQ
jgi:hypothetical protein